MAVHQISPRSWRGGEIELVQQVASRCWESIERSRISRELQSRAAVVESSTDAIISKTLDGVITSWNQFAQRVFGYTASEAIGEPVTMLFPADHINEETEIVRRIRRGERVDHYETIRRKKDGTLIPISLTISPIRNDNDEIVGASKTARDISSQKAYEARLIEQADELEQFAYVASHDLQEPLRKLGVYSDLLISRYRETAGAEAEKYTGFIADAVSRMRRLINELLTYSRANRDVAATEPVSLGAVLKGVIADLEVSIKERHATVSAGELLDVQANPFQVHQVVQNLLSNAVKFRSSRPPEIHVSATMSGNDVVVAVKDNGIGIEPEYKEKVFRVFQRLNSGNRYPGTGIGLAICKKIIEHHGGRIWVESRLGEGSTFYFTFPKSFSAPTRP